MNHKNISENIYSVKTAKTLRGRTNLFVKFINENYPEVKWVKEFKAEHLQAFLDSFGDEYSYKYITSTKALLIKLSHVLNKVYHLDIDFSKVKNNHKHTESIRDHAITTDDFINFCSFSLKKNSKYRFIPLLSSILGTRSEEAINIKLDEIDIEKGIVHLRHCKNGRDRDVTIAPEYIPIVENIKEYCLNHGYKGVVNNPNTSGYTDFLYKIKGKLGLNNKYPNEANHLFRKMYSKRRFIEEQLKGKGIEEAWVIVQHEIGHGMSNRPELFRSYIGTPFKRYLKEYSGRPVTDQPLCDFDELKKQVDYILSTREILEDLNRI